MTDTPQPERKPLRKTTSSEDKAQVVRDNAFKDLTAISAKLLAPALALVPAVVQAKNAKDEYVDVRIVLQADPGGLSELISGLAQKVKLLEIIINELVTLLALDESANALDLKEFMARCTDAAEGNAKMLQRALLSQGQVREHAGIIKPS